MKIDSAFTPQAAQNTAASVPAPRPEPFDTVAASDMAGSALQQPAAASNANAAAGAIPAAGAQAPTIDAAPRGEGFDAEVKDMKRIGAIRCETCENRRYQDGSDDPGVSFQSPQGISPQDSVSKVRSHEREHVRREGAKANREGNKIVSQSVSIHMDTCEECGRSYASGGVTRTVTKSEGDEPQSDVFMDSMRGFMANHFGNYVDNAR